MQLYVQHNHNNYFYADIFLLCIHYDDVLSLSQPSLRITDNYNATTFYTITLTSNDGNTIDSVNITSCQDEICEHEFRFPPNDALSDVQATFIGVNVFGNGTSHVANIKG